MTRVPPASFAADPERLAALASYDILDTAPESGFDDVVEVVRTVFEAKSAMISFVAGDRQWFKARIGFDVCGTGLEASVCVHALDVPEGQILVIRDLARDPRTSSSPLVTDKPRFRFYAGAPLRTAEGHVIGTLCVLDGRPRPEGLTPIQEATLRALARQIMVLLELRRALIERDAALDQHRQDERRREALIVTQAAISAASGDLGAILDHLVAGTMRAVPAAQGGAIELLDGDALVCRAAHGSLAPHQGFRVGLDGSLSGLALTGGQPILVDDAPLDSRADKVAAAQVGMRAALFVPMRRAGQPVGVLMLQSEEPGAFVARDLETAQLFAATVPLALAEVGQAAALRQVRDSERHHRAIFESAIDYAIVAIDPQGRITNWNEGARRILGWTAEQALGAHIDLFFTPEDRVAGVSAAEMRAALAKGRGIDERWHLRRDGSRFWANGEMMILRDDDSGAATGFVKILRGPHRDARGRRPARAERAGASRAAAAAAGGPRYDPGRYRLRRRARGPRRRRQQAPGGDGRPPSRQIAGRRRPRRVDPRSTRTGRGCAAASTRWCGSSRAISITTSWSASISGPTARAGGCASSAPRCAMPTAPCSAPSSRSRTSAPGGAPTRCRS